MNSPAKWLAPWCVALALSPCAHALDFEFQAPAAASDPGTAAVMRDLAGRVLPVYHDDDQERYLSSLSALQLVAGHYAAAQGSRQALGERRQDAHVTPARSDARSALVDLYARARSIEAGEQVPLAQAFDRAFAETVPKLADRDAYPITHWPGARADALEESVQQALDRLRHRDHVDQAEALRLVWTWLALDIARSVGPQLATLGADDDRRRYAIDEDVPIKLANRVVLRVRVVRPKAAAGPLPALLELADRAAAEDATASAAYGYAGLVAYPRGQKGVHDSADARAVIAWIARQRWSDGRVGLFGRDDGASAAWAAASRRPRALKAIAIEAPMARGIDALIPSGTPFAGVTIPVLAMTGDCGGVGEAALQSAQQHTRYSKDANHTLLLGACDAGATLDASAAAPRGDPVDAAAVLDLRQLRHLWFDHVLKGAPLPAVLQGRVNYEVAGRNEWRHVDSLQAISLR